MSVLNITMHFNKLSIVNLPEKACFIFNSSIHFISVIKKIQHHNPLNCPTQSSTNIKLIN